MIMMLHMSMRILIKPSIIPLRRRSSFLHGPIFLKLIINIDPSIIFLRSLIHRSFLNFTNNYFFLFNLRFCNNLRNPA